MKKSKAFTLIELIAVLVIIAILALIVTPLVLNIIKKARTSADKRSIDAYGRSIELAIADYLLDKGEFPTSIDQLQVEYTGDEVVCSTTTLNEDSTVYLAGCTVGEREVKDYTYGKEEESPTYTAYSVGDEITYNNVDYYVIKDSGETESSVTLLKAEPLTYEEVQTYSVVTGAEISDQNGYGGMEYHSSSANYETSYIKTTVDAWKASQAPSAIEVRLITKEEYKANCVEEEYQSTPSDMSVRDVPQYNWIYINNSHYWTMSVSGDSGNSIFHIDSIGRLDSSGLHNSGNIVRPVIVLSKSELN